MNVKFIKKLNEGYFNNPAQAKAKKERDAAKTNAEIISAVALDAERENIYDVFVKVLKFAEEINYCALNDQHRPSNGTVMGMFLGKLDPNSITSIAAFDYNTDGDICNDTYEDIKYEYIFNVYPSRKTITIDTTITGTVYKDLDVIDARYRGITFAFGDWYYESNSAEWVKRNAYTVINSWTLKRLATNFKKCLNAVVKMYIQYIKAQFAMTEEEKRKTMEYAKCLFDYNFEINKINFGKGKHFNLDFNILLMRDWEKCVPNDENHYNNDSNYWHNASKAVLDFMNRIYSIENLKSPTFKKY